MMMEQGPEGLEWSELYEIVEQSLGVYVDTESREKIGCSEDLVKYVQEQITQSRDAGTSCPSASAFYSFRKAVEEFDPRIAANIKPNVNLESLIPGPKRPALWKRLNEMGFKLPDLDFSWKPSLALFGGTLLAIFVIPILFVCFRPEPETDVASSIFAVVLLLGMMRLRTNILSRCTLALPRPLKTVRGMVTYLAYRNCEPRQMRYLSKGQIREAVRLAVAIEFGLPLEKLDE
ncbi:MAG: hypothetical protein GXP29_11975 [Planctomycetes bacterium]|nr:hypothetical protein [Planctomycetota bacterium]